ncbi:MAG: RidA family protein [Planctomycetes bacterium]|jgi:enamine deaminase RidA (YjgF/YER057c/UK114 family)|nr:RidA family protein [Planctomycetota bacterium]MCL4731111.1 RidA family protein [Planctomycetota bacterium]
MRQPDFINPPGWRRPRGYNNVVVLPPGRALFVAGQVGWDAQERMVSDDFVAQFRQALANVRACVEAAGGRVEHLGRVNLYVTDKREYAANLKAVGEAWREIMGRHYPAMALLEVRGLLEPGARVEIEATGVIADA